MRQRQRARQTLAAILVWLAITLILVLSQCAKDVFAQTLEAPSQTEIARYHMAKAIQGEVGVLSDLKTRAGTWVVHVILNRQDSPWFPDDIQAIVDQGFYGAETILAPSQWAYEAIDLALLERSWGYDPTAGSLFLLGGIDLTPEADLSSRVGYLEFGPFSVHAFADWPY